MKYYKEIFDHDLICPAPTCPPILYGSLKHQREQTFLWEERLEEWEIRFKEWKDNRERIRENNIVNNRFEILDL